MEPTSQYHPYRRIVLIFVGFVIGIVAISAVIIILQRIFYRNPYGNEIRIDNFADYYEAVPTDPREHIFNLLYNIVADNTPDTSIIPSSGAIIRADTAIYEERTATPAYYYGTFIVDLPALEQTYRIHFSWSPEAGNPNIASYPYMAFCPAAEYVIYPDTPCTDSLIAQREEIDATNAAYPLITALPIKIDYYSDGGTGSQVWYEIEGDLSRNEDGTDSFKVIITDYTGGNYENALQRIRNEGYNPDDYIIEYIDYQEAMTSYPAPNNAADPAN